MYDYYLLFAHPSGDPVFTFSINEVGGPENLCLHSVFTEDSVVQFYMHWQSTASVVKWLTCSPRVLYSMGSSPSRVKQRL
jgi:hypothetical protein